jgi:hypothetical protein
VGPKGRLGHPWAIYLRVDCGGSPYDWILYTPGSWASIVPHGTLAEATTPEMKLWEALFGESASTSPPPALPDPLPAFVLDALCVASGKKLANLVVRLGTGAFNDQYEPFRAAASLLGFGVSGAMGQQAYGLSRALRICFAEGVVVLGEQFRGLGVGGTIPWRAGVYPWELVAGPVPAQDPGFLPLWLFRLKNGATARDREIFASVQRQFERLAQGRSFDITFAAAQAPVPVTGPIGAGQVAIAGGEGDDRSHAGSIITVVGWNKADDGSAGRRERPIQLFGAGTWEALVLAEALARCAGRLTVFDEPAATLHPTWQTALRSELRAAAGQIALITHSPKLAPMDTLADLRRLVRISNDKGGISRSSVAGESSDGGSFEDEPSICALQ